MTKIKIRGKMAAVREIAERLDMPVVDLRKPDWHGVDLTVRMKELRKQYDALEWSGASELELAQMNLLIATTRYKLAIGDLYDMPW